jgi:hypothetical protein
VAKHKIAIWPVALGPSGLVAAAAGLSMPPLTFLLQFSSRALRRDGDGRAKSRGALRSRGSRPKDGCLSTPKTSSGLPLKFCLRLIEKDSAIARDFVANDGLSKLKTLISESSGNTLAYGLTAFATILQVPEVQAQVFAVVDDWLIDRVYLLPENIV